MGNILSSKKSSTTTTKLDPALQKKFDANYATAQTVANRPYEGYTGETVAPFTANQNQAKGLFENIAANNTGQGTLTSAVDMVNRAGAYQPQPVAFNHSAGVLPTNLQPSVVNSNIASQQIAGGGFKPGLFDAPKSNFGYTPGQVETNFNARNIQASPVSAGMFTDLDISKYMNPYNEEVVDRTQADLEKQRQVMQLQTNSAADAGKAFGGSRHGVTAAITNDDWGKNAGGIVAALRAAGYDRAADIGAQDLNRKLTADTTTAGMRLAADQSNQTRDLNLNQLSLNAQGMNQNAQADAARVNQATSFANQASQLSTNAMNSDNQYRGAALDANVAQANQQADLAAKGMSQQGEIANLQASLQAAGMNLDAQRFNEDAQYRAAVQQMAAQIQNQGAGAEAARLQLASGQSLAGMAGQELSMEQSRAGSLFDIGQAEQATNQAQNQAQFDEFMRQWTYPMMQQDMRNQSVAMIPQTGTNTNVQKSTPGLFDWAMGLGGLAMGGAEAGLFGGGSKGYQQMVPTVPYGYGGPANDGSLPSGIMYMR